MSTLRVGIIGCGKRGAMHAVSYACADGAQIVACADPVEDNAKALAKTHGVDKVYADYRDMLAAEDLDMVSVCTWIGQHTEMITAAAESGARAIFSEKPMAPTWGEAKRQHEVCAKHNVQLTFSHQRRFDPRFYKAKLLANDGTIGELVRVEGSCSNLFDWGTHWFDMFFFFNNEQPAASVIAQIDAKGTRDVFGTPMEGAGVAWVQWRNGLQGLMVTGHAGSIGSSSLVRAIGTQGVIEVGDGGKLRRLTYGGDWRTDDGSDTPIHAAVEQTIATIDRFKADASGPPLGPAKNIAATAMVVQDSIRCLGSDEEPMHGSAHALQATELIFASYESSRRRAKVELPLDVDDSAFLAMLADGTMKREPIAPEPA